MNVSNRWLSRKFLVSFLTQVAAVLVLMWPEHAAAIDEAATSITALVVLALTSLGYVAAEAAVDRKRLEGEVTEAE